MARSPGITLIENEIGQSIPTGGAGTTATVGRYAWGPAFEQMSISDPADLLERVKTPTRDLAYSFLSTEILARNSNDVRLIRVVDTNTALNSVATQDVILPTIDTPGTGYAVNDAIEVEVDSTIVTTGEVTEVGSGGEIEAVTIEPFEGTLTGATVTITTAGGSGGSISVERLSSDTLILNDNDVENKLGDVDLRANHNQLNIPALFGRYPGAYGNNIIVDVVSFEDFDTEVSLTNPATGASETVSFANLSEQPTKSGQYALIVRDGDSVVFESTVSTIEGDTNLFGQSIYIDDMAERGSLGVVTGSAEFGWDATSTGRYVFGGGADGDVTAGMYTDGWDLHSDESQTPARVMSTGPVNGEESSTAATVSAYARDSIASVRADTLVTLGTPARLIAGLAAADAFNAELEYITGEDSGGQPVTPNIAGTSKYSTFSHNAKWTYDRFNDRRFWMDTSSDKAARILNVLSAGTSWQSAAGPEFGTLSNVSKLAYNPTESQRNQLYTARANPVVLNNGSYYFRGDKTQWPEPSNFSRENVRQVFNRVKTDIRTRAAALEFQSNTLNLRRQYKNESDAYMRNLQSRGGIEAFRNIVEQLNTPEVRANNEFRARHLIKPQFSINFAILTFTAVGPNVDFEELEG